MHSLSSRCDSTQCAQCGEIPPRSPRTRTPGRSRAWSTLPALLALFAASLFLVGFGSPPTLVDRDQAPSYRLTVGQQRQMVTAQQPPPVTSRAVLLYDVDADRVLMAQNATLALPPASLTKLLTALMILEEGNLDAKVQIQPGDLAPGASMGLQAGEVLTVEQLLWGLLIPSGNDAAMALARHSAGTVDVFVQRMNIRAQELGLEQTRFANPHGLDAPGHTSSAQDLLTLAKLNLQYPLFREIVATRSTTVAGHLLNNTNRLLSTFPGADGIKTGTTDAAGQCLVASITRGGHQVIAIVLGSGDRYGEVEAIYRRYQENYRWQQGLGRIGLTLADRLFDLQGKLWILRPQGAPPEVFLPRWEQLRLTSYRRLQLPPPGQPWTAGMVVGQLEWRLGDQLIGVQPLVLE